MIIAMENGIHPIFHPVHNSMELCMETLYVVMQLIMYVTNLIIIREHIV